MNYALCGLMTQSDLPLAELPPWTGERRGPDIVIRLGDVPERLDDLAHHGPLLQVRRDGACRFAIAGVADFLVENGERVTILPRMELNAPDIRVFLLGSVFGFLCHQRGLLPLHAGCVEIGGRAVAFAGPSGVGKSTMTAAFMRRGHSILSDDVTVVDASAPGGPTVLPSFPRIKLWRDTADGLGIAVEGLERSRKKLEKFHLPVEERFRTEPLPLAAVYHLATVHDARHAGLTRLRGGDAMNALVGAVYRRLAAIRMGRRAELMTVLAKIAAMPGLRLSRRPDLKTLDEAVDLIAARHPKPDGRA